MHATSKSALIVVFSAFFSGLVSACAPQGMSSGFVTADRTAGRSVSGMILPPPWLIAEPGDYNFSARMSNSDPATQHPHQWDGQYWDAKKWNPRWTPAIAIRKFYNAGIFTGQSLTSDALPVVSLGPTFYQLSDLDQRRTLKLLVDYMSYLKEGYPAVELVDWHTRDIVGAYTAKGMFLN